MESVRVSQVNSANTGTTADALWTQAPWPCTENSFLCLHCILLVVDGAQFIAQFWDCKARLKYNNNEQNSLHPASAIGKEEQLLTLCVLWCIYSIQYNVVLAPDHAVGI